VCCADNGAQRQHFSTGKRRPDDGKEQHSRVAKLRDLEMLVRIAMRHPCLDRTNCIIAAVIAVCMLLRVLCGLYFLCLNSKGVLTTAQAAMEQAATRDGMYAEIIAVTITVTCSGACALIH
jgi:hypothetical protein